MFPDLISPTADFEHQLGACVNAMGQDDAIGQILVFERMRGTLHMRHIASADLADTDINGYEMVVFDGGNTSGDTWKHAREQVGGLQRNQCRGLFDVGGEDGLAQLVAELECLRGRSEDLNLAAQVAAVAAKLEQPRPTAIPAALELDCVPCNCSWGTPS